MIWVGSYFQVGLEAMIPVNRESGTGVGFLGQIASLSRRHVPEHARPAAARRHVDRSPQTHLLRSTQHAHTHHHRIASAHGAGTAGARAHAFLDHASPLVGSTVPTAPHELTLSFTQNLEPAFSTVEVIDANGARVDQGKPQISGNTMRVGAQSRWPGNLSRSLARALGRHPHDPGQLHLPCRRTE